MSLFRIALRSIQQRGVASLLTILSMGLGVMLVVAVLSIHGIVSRSFANNANLGYNMIVGAKGGREQLVLNTVYYLSSPVENVKYEYYLEFLDREARERELKTSLRAMGHDQKWSLTHADAALLAGGPGGLLASQALAALEPADAKASDFGRNGKFAAQLRSRPVPVCLGDYYGRFRVVGTTTDLFGELLASPAPGSSVDENSAYRPTIEFAAGRNFEPRSLEHGYFEAVVGAQVAREMNVKLGDGINPAHGDPKGHTHERKFIVVGILKPSGTPYDRAVFVNMEGFFLMEDHAKPVDDPRTSDTPAPAKPAELSEEEARRQWEEQKRLRLEVERASDPDPLPLEQREITALLVSSEPSRAIFLADGINKGKEAQAVAPVAVITGLFAFIVDPIQNIFLFLTAMICIVSGISILVSIYNSMSERRHEIAVMRALGAGRGSVMAIILLESALLSLAGCFVGWLAGHLLCLGASPWVEEYTGVQLGFSLWSEPFYQPLGEEGWRGLVKLPVEWVLVPALLALAVVVGLWPAVSAYHTDVAESLGK